MQASLSWAVSCALGLEKFWDLWPHPHAGGRPFSVPAHGEQCEQAELSLHHSWAGGMDLASRSSCNHQLHWCPLAPAPVLSQEPEHGLLVGLRVNGNRRALLWLSQSGRQHVLHWREQKNQTRLSMAGNQTWCNQPLTPCSRRSLGLAITTPSWAGPAQEAVEPDWLGNGLTQPCLGTESCPSLQLPPWGDGDADPIPRWSLTHWANISGATLPPPIARALCTDSATRPSHLPATMYSSTPLTVLSEPLRTSPDLSWHPMGDGTGLGYHPCWAEGKRGPESAK